MGSSIERAQAKRLIDFHSTLLERLAAAEQTAVRIKKAILHASNAMIAQEALSILREIPIDEINRDKQGYRVKALREHGYCTLADIATASVYDLAAVHGISEESARKIHEDVQQMAAEARSGVKIRLSIDDRNEYAANLLAAVCAYRRSKESIAACARLRHDYGRTIVLAIEKLKPATTTLKWLFMSKAKRSDAEDAYAKLQQLANDAYAKQAKTQLEALSAAETCGSNDAWQDFSENSIEYFKILEDINPGVLGTDEGKLGLPEALAREVESQEVFPNGLRCTLRRYQEWGVKYILRQERVLLGDEMGLGKTIQAIAAMVSLRNTGATHFLVVCPASVIVNWCREISRMSLLNVIRMHGADRENALRTWIEAGGVAVTTYETSNQIELAQDFRFSMLVADEAHYLKNPQAKRTRSVKVLGAHAERLLYMTGTALENRVDEMVELIRQLQPRIALSLAGKKFIATAPWFREIIAPVYYRRRRADVLTELPELIEKREWCELSRAEEQIYEKAVLDKRYADARRVSWNVPDLSASSKAERMLKIIQNAQADGRKVIVFSFFLDTIQKICACLGERCSQPINGSVPPQRRQEIIDRFDAAPAGAVLAAQIQAGGTGLNIQSASVVIICEPQLKPSVENQAISRAYRMGQTRNVLVYRLLCEDTVDERITEQLESKQAVFNAFADQSVAAEESLELDEKAFGGIIEEEIERIRLKNNMGAAAQN